MILVGSHALVYRLGRIRTPLDIDYIGTYDELVFYLAAKKDVIEAVKYVSDRKALIKRVDCMVEFSIAWEDTTDNEVISFGGEKIPFDDMEVVVPSIDVLYELKTSHRYLKNSPHFLKTLNDRLILESAGAKVAHPDFLKRREKETYNYAHPKLNVDKYNFFKDDAIKYIYDHDTIHLAMAHKEKPAYMYFKPEDKEVMVSKAMWDTLDEEIKLYSVVEESYVLALERSQIPHKNLITPTQSFDMALMKVCTSITSGWWREYAYNNYYKARNLFNPKYVNIFWAAEEKGIVKKLQSN